MLNRQSLDRQRGRPLPVDDIPLAQRNYPISPRRRQPLLSFFFKIAALCLLGTASVALLLRGPLRGWLEPPPVAGLAAKLSADGRLLGHFPYPEAKPSELLSVAPGLQLRADAAKSFLAMQQAAAADGVALRLLSAYRSIETQRELFFEVKAERNQTSLDRAKVSAPPGFSEHSTGYAVDVGDLREPQTNLSSSFIKTSAYRWLLENAARFHFTLSFPRDNPQGVSFEPWHWRFEGSTDSLLTFDPAHRFQQAKGP